MPTRSARHADGPWAVALSMEHRRHDRRPKSGGRLKRAMRAGPHKAHPGMHRRPLAPSIGGYGAALDTAYRIGEAAHLRPPQASGLRLLTANVSSWGSATRLLGIQDVDVILIEEHKLREGDAARSARSLARRAG